eukprot:EC838437.1.p2 GENE.EC838437.1~~EC838437.1.p2  ORF type:complete len:104 (-),score=7.60 EC838437.1:12-323(-)
MKVAARGEGNNAGCTVVREEDENLILRGGLNNLARANTLHGQLVTLENLEEVRGGHLAALVVNGIRARVHVGAVDMVDDIALNGVLGAGGNIVVAMVTMWSAG